MNEENTKELRKEFAKVFNWYEYKNEYGYSRTQKELKEPSWAEIFAEIGRLQERGREIITSESDDLLLNQE